MSQEAWIETQIRLAIEQGKFDDLPGAGKPIPNLHRAGDPRWWVREKARAEGLNTSAMLPPSLRLRKEVEQCRDTIADLPSEQAVREVVDDLNERIREHWRSPSSGPAVPVGLVDMDETLERWRVARRARDSAAVPPPHQDARPDDQEKEPRHRWWRLLIDRRRGGRTSSSGPDETRSPR